jgi:hypothetical protein
MCGRSKFELDVGTLRGAKVSNFTYSRITPLNPERQLSGDISSFACYTRALPGVGDVTTLLFCQILACEAWNIFPMGKRNYRLLFSSMRL